MGRGDVDTHVLVVGAGFAGICVGHDLLDAGIDDFTIVEMADGVGGTWRHNTFPGAACDVPSHAYCFSFRGNPGWSRAYSPQAEIQAYLEDCVKEFGLDPHLRLGCEVTSHTFDDTQQCWRTELADGTSISSHFVVKATGILHQPRWPVVPGRERFAGPLMHSARWDHDVDFAGKRVAVIGSAASAVQIVPELAEVAAEVAVFQRSPNYVLPRNDEIYSDEQIEAWRADPQAFDAFRREMATVRNARLAPLFVAGSEANRGVMRFALEHMRSIVADPDLRDKLTPNYELGCKRLLISDNWYQTLVLPHVDVVAQALTGFTESAVVTADGEHEVDIVVCATGYDPEAGHRAIPTIGPGGRSLADVWADDLVSYRGVAVPGFPNLLLVDGPNSASGYLASVETIEVDSRYVTRLITEVGAGRLATPARERADEWCETLQARFDATVWAGSCGNWYQAPDGRIWTLFPGDLDEYTADKAAPSLEDFEITERSTV